MQTTQDWPGRESGVRKPDTHETPLSDAEIRFAVWRSIVKKTDVAAVAVDQQLDDIDRWPVERRFRPAGTWERKNAALLAKPTHWDGLAQ